MKSHVVQFQAPLPILAARTRRLALGLLVALQPLACDDPDAPEFADPGDTEAVEDSQVATDALAAIDSLPTALTSTELSQLLLGGNYPVTNPYAPNGVHAGIDFASTAAVSSPVNGVIKANTPDCGKVAILDDQNNTVILAHMSNRTGLSVGSQVTVGTYLGKASNVVGGGCTATASHLHLEIRQGLNTSMAIPSANNTATTFDPLTYVYGGFPPVTLLTPTANSTVFGNPVWLEWKTTQGATSYRLQISKTNSFTANTCTNGCAHESVGSSTNRSTNLTAGTYYWRVRAGNSGQGGEWSAVRMFKKN